MTELVVTYNNGTCGDTLLLYKKLKQLKYTIYMVKCTCTQLHVTEYPLNKRINTFGMDYFIFYREVFLYSEVEKMKTIVFIFSTSG